VLSLAAAQKEFEPAGIYLNTASIGLPPRRTVAALDEAIETWRTGRAEAAGYDGLISEARQRFATLVGTTPERVAIGNQVSTFTGLVASALEDCFLRRGGADEEAYVAEVTRCLAAHLGQRAA